MKKEKLCLIGCGWLGKPLALHLITEGYKVVATTAHDKSAEFSAEGVPYCPYDLSSNSPVPIEISEADTLIYTIPPLELDIIKSFFDKISPDKKIIFTTSTSVYGKNLGDVDENFKINLENTSSPLLVQTEEYMRTRFKNLTIIRPGGLYGNKRHPIFFLQGKKNLTTGEELLHLAHQQDCIKAITAVIEMNAWNETFNIVSDLRIPKKVYYVAIAKKLNLTPPEYDEVQNNQAQTKISNEKSKRELKINYLDPNLF